MKGAVLQLAVHRRYTVVGLWMWDTCMHTITYHKTNSDLLVSVKMINIRYGLVLIILLVLAELCAGQLCTTNYCCQYCNYY